MKSATRPALCLLATAGILVGCARESSSVWTPAFTRVDVPGVATDHASTGGVGWVDYDGDGDLDLFVTNGYDVSAEAPAGQTNRLYRNDGAAGFVAVTAGALATSAGISSGHTWGDYDNDGDLDVFITNQHDQDNQLFRNEGGGAFTEITDAPQVGDGGHSYAAAWIDYDQDGWLDLFVANGGMSHVGANGLYRGTGDGGFEKVTDGALVTDEAATCGIAWGDYDNDGDPDLFLANQGFAPPSNHNALYRNDGGGSFTRLAEGPVVNDGTPSCAAAWVDVDNDLDLDLHVTTLYGLADLLYVNDGAGVLTPVADDHPVLAASYGFGASWADFDNDGDADLVVANWGAAPDLYVNDGRGGFARVDGGDLGGRVEFVGAVAAADADGDGDVDLYLGNWPNEPGDGEPNAFYRNDGDGGHWLGVRLVGTASNRAGIGARVLLSTATGAVRTHQLREVTTQAGFRGQGDLSPRFGLGAAVEARAVEVLWPSGRVSRLENVAAGQVVEVTEPE